MSQFYAVRRWTSLSDGRRTADEADAERLGQRTTQIWGRWKFGGEVDDEAELQIAAGGRGREQPADEAETDGKFEGKRQMMELGGKCRAESE